MVAVGSSEHHAAALALVRAAMPAGILVFDGDPSVDDGDLTWPHLCVWTGPGSREQTSLEGRDRGLQTLTTIRSIGTSTQEVLSALDTAAEALQEITPTISGRSCNYFRQVPNVGPPPAPEPGVRTPDGRKIYSSFLLFGLYSTAA